MIPNCTCAKSHLPGFPIATAFTNSVGEFARYFFKNNPWKVTVHNNVQKVYRYCIVCADNRFTDEEWSKQIDINGPPTICKKTTCWEALSKVLGIVPTKHLMLTTVEDLVHVKLNKENEHFEDISPVTSFIFFDRVYTKESEMPKIYRETLKHLETIPIMSRIAVIDSLYFERRDKFQLEMGGTMSCTDDPYLKALADYRRKCIAILLQFRSKL